MGLTVTQCVSTVIGNEAALAINVELETQLESCGCRVMCGVYLETTI